MNDASYTKKAMSSTQTREFHTNEISSTKEPSSSTKKACQSLSGDWHAIQFILAYYKQLVRLLLLQLEVHLRRYQILDDD